VQRRAAVMRTLRGASSIICLAMSCWSLRFMPTSSTGPCRCRRAAGGISSTMKRSRRDRPRSSASFRSMSSRSLCATARSSLKVVMLHRIWRHQFRLHLLAGLSGRQESVYPVASGDTS
jgi:hypothetical protein